MFLIALLPSKSLAQSYNGASGVVLTYEVSGDQVTITGMTTAPSDGKLVIPSEIEGKAVTKLGDNAFNWNSSITSVEVSATVKRISNSFVGCSNLSQVTFAEDSKLEAIDTYAFRYTNIAEITIPQTVTFINSDAFDSCEKLTTFTMLSNTPCNNNGGMFGSSVASGLKIIVPAGSLEAYKTASGWSDYAELMQEAAPTSISHTTTSASAKSAAIYTLDGRLASKDGNTQALAKGIYVQNGKKVVIGK